MYIKVYAGIMVLMFFVSLARSIAMFRFCTRASKKLHDNMFNSLISTSMRFFGLNSSGRMLNRFSKDMGTVDERLPRSLGDAAHTNLNMIGAIIVTAFIDFKFLIVVIVLTALFLLIRKIYLNVSTDLKRLEGASMKFISDSDIL